MSATVRTNPLFSTLLGAALATAGLLGVGCGGGEEVDELAGVAEAATPSLSQEELARLGEESRLRLEDIGQWHVLPSEAGALEGLFIESRDTGLLRAATERMVQEQSASWPAGLQREFLETLAPDAVVLSSESMVPPSVTLAQAALESGWGRSGLAAQHNNLFGVKSGAARGGVAMVTTEGGGESAHTITARFRTYESWGESLRHHQRVLVGDRRYQRAMERNGDWRGFIGEVAPLWATDPLYERRVGSIVERYDLDRWDRLVAERAAYQGR